MNADTIQDIRDAHAEKEKDQILRVLRHVNGNVARASRALGISRYALLRRMNKYEISKYKGR